LKEIALSGLRVIEIGQNVAGPFCSALLGDFGAEIIKIEIPGTGDSLRSMGTVINNSSTWFAVEARNKKSITINLKESKGREIFKNLVKLSDVVVENFRPGTLEKLGLGWENLQKVNKKIILVSISGFGQTGPYKTRYAYNRMGLAMGGLIYITGYHDRCPIMIPIALADYLTGMFAALGTMYAIYYRDVRRKNVGQIVDIGLYESVFRIMEGTVVDYGLTGKIRERIGTEHPGSIPGGHYKTKDGKWIAISVGNNRVFERFLDCISMSELKNDSRYKTQPDRLKHRIELERITKEWISKHTLEECSNTFNNEIPFAPIFNIKDIFEDKQYKARENIISLQDEKLGQIKMQNVVPNLSVTPGKVNWSGPPLGKDNEKVFKDILGLDEKEINKLHRDKII